MLIHPKTKRKKKMSILPYSLLNLPAKIYSECKIICVYAVSSLN